MMQSLGRLYAIALNTLREAVRDKVLYAVTVLAAGVVFGTRILGELSLDQEARVVRDLGITAISLFGVLVSLFLGSSLLYKEIERKTLYMVLPKPVHRWEFLVGKFAGIALTGGVFLLIIGGLFMLLLGEQSGGSIWIATGGFFASIALLLLLLRYIADPTIGVVGWALGLFIVGTAFAAQSGELVSVHLRALLLIGGEVAVLTAVAMFFSSFSTPFLTGALSAGLWVVGRNADTLQEIQSRLLPDEIKTLLHGLAEVVPNFNLFVPGTTTIGATSSAPWAYVSTSMAYAGAYVCVLLVLASLIFRRRDLA